MFFSIVLSFSCHCALALSTWSVLIRPSDPPSQLSDTQLPQSFFFTTLLLCHLTVKKARRKNRFLSQSHSHIKKNVPRHILAPRRGCFGNPLPLRRVRILAERFCMIGRNFLSYKKELPPIFSGSSSFSFSPKAPRYQETFI